jgi:hypothetical protein
MKKCVSNLAVRLPPTGEVRSPGPAEVRSPRPAEVRSPRPAEVRSPRPAEVRSPRPTQQPKNQPNPPNDMPPIAPQRRAFRPHFTYLHRLVLTRSRAAECRKANHFLTHLALLVGPQALSRPTTAQNSLGRGRSPPCAPPGAAARRAAGLRPAGKLRLRRKIEGNRSPRRTALNNPGKAQCRNSVRLGVG